jgi:hypothetical protein
VYSKPTDAQDFHDKSEEYANYLITCGHDEQHVRNKFAEVASMTRQEARRSKKRSNINVCIFSGKYNPRGPESVRFKKIGRKKKKEVICGDEKAIDVLPEGAICVAYKRNANLKELLAPADPYKDRSRTSRSL